jgi:hypothetical protein
MFTYSLGEHQQGSAISDLYESRQILSRVIFKRQFAFAVYRQSERIIFLITKGHVVCPQNNPTRNGLSY